MAGETVITIVGNLARDPELRFTSSGVAVTNFTVASTPRLFDKQAGEWRDGETLWMDCSVWREQAEHVADSLMKGSRVIVSGTLSQRTYETKEGEQRTRYQLNVDEVGPSLRNATAKTQKASRGSGSSRDGWGGGADSGAWDSAPNTTKGGFDEPAPF